MVNLRALTMGVTLLFISTSIAAINCDTPTEVFGKYVNITNVACKDDDCSTCDGGFTLKITNITDDWSQHGSKPKAVAKYTTLVKIIGDLNISASAFVVGFKPEVLGRLEINLASLEEVDGNIYIQNTNNFGYRLSVQLPKLKSVTGSVIIKNSGESPSCKLQVAFSVASLESTLDVTGGLLINSTCSKIEQVSFTKNVHIGGDVVISVESGEIGSGKTSPGVHFVEGISLRNTSQGIFISETSVDDLDKHNNENDPLYVKLNQVAGDLSEQFITIRVDNRNSGDDFDDLKLDVNGGMHNNVHALVTAKLKACRGHTKLQLTGMPAVGKPCLATPTPTIAPSIPPTAQPSSSPSALLRSEKTCESFGWGSKVATPSVCGQSSINGTCYKGDTFDFDSAINVCASVGARLCTRNEIGHDVVQGTGCGMDKLLIWSGDSEGCNSGEHYISPSRGSFITSTTSVTCKSDLDSSYNIRCCADRQTLPPTQGPTFTPSSFPTAIPSLNPISSPTAVPMNSPSSSPSALPSPLPLTPTPTQQPLKHTARLFEETSIASTIVASTRAPALSNSPTSSPLTPGLIFLDIVQTEETQTQGVSPTVIVLIGVISGSMCFILILCLVIRQRKRKQPLNKIKIEDDGVMENFVNNPSYDRLSGRLSPSIIRGIKGHYVEGAQQQQHQHQQYNDFYMVPTPVAEGDTYASTQPPPPQPRMCLKHVGGGVEHEVLDQSNNTRKHQLSTHGESTYNTNPTYVPLTRLASKHDERALYDVKIISDAVEDRELAKGRVEMQRRALVQQRQMASAPAEDEALTVSRPPLEEPVVTSVEPTPPPPQKLVDISVTFQPKGLQAPPKKKLFDISVVSQSVPMKPKVASKWDLPKPKTAVVVQPTVQLKAVSLVEPHDFNIKANGKPSQQDFSNNSGFNDGYIATKLKMVMHDEDYLNADADGYLVTSTAPDDGYIDVELEGEDAFANFHEDSE